MKEKGKNIGHLLIWVVYALVIGAVVGVCGFAFDKVLEMCTEFRTEHNRMLYLLPAAGVLIVAFYCALGVKLPRGTNRILEAAEKGDKVPFRVAPMIFVATALTHLTGGSAGREGAALQLGGSIAGLIGQTGEKLKLGKPDYRVITMCGMASGFSALFGTPLAAAIFALEVTNNTIHYAALLPSMLSSVAATVTARALGGGVTAFELGAIPALTLPVLGKVVALSVLTGLLAIGFVAAMEHTGELYAKILKNQYVRVLVGAAVVIALSLLEGSRDYNGAGMDVIRRAVSGEAVWYAFLFKLLLTALTLGAGFKGGEIVPTLFVGATFGCTVSPLLGLPAGFSAGFCMAALFCGVTNCPLAAIFLAGELFGWQGIVFCALGCCVSYIVSGKYSLYTAQKLNFSKLKMD